MVGMRSYRGVRTLYEYKSAMVLPGAAQSMVGCTLGNDQETMTMMTVTTVTTGRQAEAGDAT